MNFISKDQYRTLAQHQHEYCLSIYIPTHRSGKEVLEGQDAIHLKNQVKAAGQMLENQGLESTRIKQLLAPLQAIAQDRDFWHYRSDGTVFFVSPESMDYFTVPIHFEPFTFLDDHFYLKPLTPLFSGDERFFLLAISQKQVRFFEATRYSLSDVKIDDLVPDSLEEAVGHDYEQKSLQFRSGQTAEPGGARFHGQGRSNDDVDQIELEKFLRAVDDGLMQMLHDEAPPMVIAAVDRVATAYRNISQYHNILSSNISGNPDHADRLVLHKEAIKLLEASYLSKEKTEKKEQYQANKVTGCASSDPEEILHKAINGGVDTLFVDKEQPEIYGAYLRDIAKLRFDPELTDNNTPLTDLAIKSTLLQSGQAYLVDSAEMPEEVNEAMCAIFRY